MPDLTRKSLESVLIGSGINVRRLKVERNQVRLGIESPAELLDAGPDAGSTTTTAGRPPPRCSPRSEGRRPFRARTGRDVGQKTGGAPAAAPSPDSSSLTEPLK